MLLVVERQDTNGLLLFLLLLFLSKACQAHMPKILEHWKYFGKNYTQNSVETLVPDFFLRG